MLQTRISWTQQWLDNGYNIGEIFLKWKKKLCGKWKHFWMQYGEKMKASIGIGCISQADRYCDIASAVNDRSLYDIYDAELSTMPTDVCKVWKAILAYKREKNPKKARKKSKSHKADKAKQQKQKIQTYAATKGYETLKIPTNKTQQKFILSLIDENKSLSDRVKKSGKSIISQSVKIKSLKLAKQKHQNEYAKLLAHKQQIKMERDDIYKEQGLLLTLLTKKDEKIADLISVCRKELKAMSNKNMTETEQHLNELIDG